MKYKLGLLTVVSVVLLAVCQGCNVSHRDDVYNNDASSNTMDMQFVINGISVDYNGGSSDDGEALSPIRKATITSEGMTDLWVYEGTTLLKHQVSTDADFGIPTISLTYGAHDIVFVASKSSNQSFTTNWSCDKIGETFAKILPITVSGSSSNSRQVELSRRTGKVMWTIEDAVPSTVSKLHVKVATCYDMDASLSGITPSFYETTISITAWQGITGKSPLVHVITSSSTDEEDTYTLIEFLGADDTVLYSYERTVGVKPNRCTNIHGTFFSGGVNSVTLNTTWDTQLDVLL